MCVFGWIMFGVAFVALWRKTREVARLKKRLREPLDAEEEELLEDDE